MKSQRELADGEYVVKTVTQRKNNCGCWYGKTCRDGCDKYEDGKCTGIVHPTYPPQLGDCPFANKACPVLDSWGDVAAGDPETWSGQSTMIQQSIGIPRNTKKEQANKTENKQMGTENQWIVNQVRLVYDYAIEQLEKASENKVLVGRHVLDQIVAGLWLVVKDTLGDGFSMDAKIKARDEDTREDAVVEEMDPREDVPVAEKKEDKKEAEIFGYPVSYWTKVFDEHDIDCPGLLDARLTGFEEYRKIMRKHGIKNGHEELDNRLSAMEDK